MSMTRRAFLQAMAAALVMPVGDTLAALDVETINEYLDIGDGIRVRKIGVVDFSPEPFKAIRFHLMKQVQDGRMLESYCDIDKWLYDIVPDSEKRNYIVSEISSHKKAILLAEKNPNTY